MELLFALFISGGLLAMLVIFEWWTQQIEDEEQSPR